MIVWSRSNQERYSNRSSMRPGLFGVSRRWPRKRTRGNDGTSLHEQWNFSLTSVQFVGLILPSNSHAEIWTCLYAPAISSHNCPTEYALPPSLEWHVWSSSSGNNSHVVHRSLSSGASLCDGTVGFVPYPMLSAKLYFTNLSIVNLGHKCVTATISKHLVCCLFHLAYRLTFPAQTYSPTT